MKYNSQHVKSQGQDSIHLPYLDENSSENDKPNLFEDLVNEAQASQQDKADDYNDIFKDIAINSDEVPAESMSELEKIFADTSLGENTKAELLAKDEGDHPDEAVMNIDLTDEEAVHDKKTAEDLAIIQKEKELFMNIFNTYSQKDTQKSRKHSHSHILWNLREAMSSTRSKIDLHVSRAMRPSVGGRLTQDTIEKMFQQFDSSLESTYTYLLTLELKEGYLDFLREIFRRFNERDTILKDFFLTMKKNESLLEFTKRYGELSAQVRRHSEESPSAPLLNAYTMPLLFNHIMTTFSTKFYDGVLALTIVNLLKKDLRLYSVVCNQETFNEILKLYWVYYGKLSLQEIELTYMEMRNNGFMGNLRTFRILREIIIRYHALKLGKSGMRFWLREDDTRVKRLEKKLKLLSEQLKNL